ncbi:udp-glycosyltransferase 73c2 [Nicotiana attenuata]|uniref:Glycosyltransferase n=1 Tax=Nicotiana attenuata TaxID=49451 RepID=A0A1J6IWK4_NICAT|nr:udp-glycosyltransferase 73c2 [Nicotiana attenuata]
MASNPALAELNFVLIPLLSASRIIPMVDIAKLLAQRGVTVTLVLTPLNAAPFTAVIDRAMGSGLLIRVLELQFPAKEAGLPEGCESLNLLPSMAFVRNFYNATDMLQNEAENLLEEMKPKPSCIISDTLIAWTADTADKFQIPRILFDGMSCFSQVCLHNLYIMKDQNKIPDSGSFVIPDLPDKIEVTKAQLPAAFHPGTISIQDIRDKIRAAETRSYGVVINTFEELETENIKMRGNKASFDKEESLTKWLDSWQPESIVYACLGSLGRIPVVQFVELALGLEASGYPFILVIKAGEGQEPIEDLISKNGFEERTKERGLLIRGWAPQVLILSHPAIGGFLTHCGWNSTLEGISAGVPMITWPLLSEQFLNERFIVHVLKTGVSVGCQEVVHFGEEGKFEAQVSKEEVTKAIKTVMDKEKEGKESRKRARELGEMAKRAVESAGSSYLSLELLIKEIQEFQLNKSA